MLRPDFGDVTSEYLALRSGRAYVSDFSEIVWVTGEEAITFLNGQASQDVAGMVAGTTARSFLLEPRGKLVDLLWLLRGEDRVGLVTGAGRGTGVIEHLDGFRFRVDVGLTLDERPVIEVWGSDLSAVAGKAGLSRGSGWVDSKGVTVALLVGQPLGRLLLAGFDADGLKSLGLTPAGRVAADAVRVEACEPVMGVDVDETTIPQESGLVAESVSFTKGCYVGQELVARIDSRGRVNRRLAGVSMATNVVPPPGSEVLSGGVIVGSVSTVGQSLAMRAPIGLAMIHRGVEYGSEVTIRWESGSTTARVHDLPLDDFSGISHSSYIQDRE